MWIMWTALYLMIGACIAELIYLDGIDLDWKEKCWHSLIWPLDIIVLVIVGAWLLAERRRY